LGSHCHSFRPATRKPENARGLRGVGDGVGFRELVVAPG
jgi:hypothetical protein